jgi:hypothetical protein
MFLRAIEKFMTARKSRNGNAALNKGFLGLQWDLISSLIRHQSHSLEESAPHMVQEWTSCARAGHSQFAAIF